MSGSNSARHRYTKATNSMLIFKSEHIYFFFLSSWSHSISEIFFKFLFVHSGFGNLFLSFSFSRSLDGSIFNPVVNVFRHRPVDNDKSDVQDGVCNSPENVGGLVKHIWGLSGHEEGHVTNPLKGKRSKSSHLEGTRESSSCSWGIVHHDDHPDNGKRHPWRGHHVYHSLMMLWVTLRI